MAVRRTIQSAPKVAPISGGGGITAAPHPTIISAVSHNEPDATGAVHTIVEVLWKPPVNRQDFTGVHAWIENPDFSGVADPAGIDADTALTLDVTPLPSPQSRQDCGRFAFHAADMDVAGQIRSRMPAIAAPKEKEAWRLYLEGYNASYDQLVPLPDLDHSPTATFDVDPGIYGIGQEYAPLVTNVAVAYELLWSVPLGKWQGRIRTTWSDPDPTSDPERFKQFSGVVVTFEFADHSRVDLPFAAAGAMASLQDYCDVPAVQVIRVWARSVGVNRAAINTISEGVTPNAYATTLAAPAKGDVSGWTVTAAYNTANLDGSRQLVITTAWTAPPDDPTFASIDVWVYNQASATWNIFARQDKAGAFSIEERFWPAVTQSWDFYAISITNTGSSKCDFSTHSPGASPKRTVSLVPFSDASLVSGDQVYANDVTSFNAFSSAATTADGVDCFQFGGTFNKPADTRYKGCKIVARPAGGTGSTDFTVALCGPADTSFLGAKTTTPAAATGYTIYAVSCDASGNYNPITPGSTPAVSVTVTPGSGGIKMPRLDPNTYDSSVFGIVNSKFAITATPLNSLKAGTYDPAVFGNAVDGKFKLNFNATQFDTTLGYLRIKAIDAGTITTGTLYIGGSGITGLTVYNAVNGPIGWIGTNGSVYGAWFAQFWAGGTSPLDAKLRIDGGGNLTLYGTLYGSASQFTGSIAASQITTSTLQVGGSGQATGIYAYQWNGSANQLVGWMGSNGSMNGAWFRNLWIGGAQGPYWNGSSVSPNDAKIYLDNSGAAWFTGTITASTITGSTLTLASGGNTASITASGIYFQSYTGAKALLAGSQLGIYAAGSGSFNAYLSSDGYQTGLYLSYNGVNATLSISGGTSTLSVGAVNASGTVQASTLSSSGIIGASGAIYEYGAQLSARYAAYNHSHSFSSISGGTCVLPSPLRFQDILIQSTGIDLASTPCYRSIQVYDQNGAYMGRLPIMAA